MLTPFGSQIARELHDTGFGGVVRAADKTLQSPRISTPGTAIKTPREGGKGQTYPIRNMPTHRRNERHTPSIPMPNHLLRNRLRRHHDPRDIDRKHPIRVLSRILQRRRLLLDPRRSNQAIHPTLRIRDCAHDLVQRRHIPHVNLPIMQRGPQLLSRPLLDAEEVRAGLRQAVQRVHGRARFEQRFGLHEPEAACRTCYEHDFVVQRELGKAFRRA